MPSIFLNNNLFIIMASLETRLRGTGGFRLFAVRSVKFIKPYGTENNRSKRAKKAGPPKHSTSFRWAGFLYIIGKLSGSGS